MASKAQVRAALKRQGATWDESYDTFDAPEGQCWNASGCHSIAVVYDDWWTPMSERYDGYIEQINGGTFPCEGCDECE